jgi:hypothetical protein
MRARNLEPRDLEILRTLLRLRFLPTHQIIGAFFAGDRAGRRRIQRLRALGLIQSHSKGTEAIGYCAWRVTARAIDVLTEAYPNEHVPDGVIERTNETRLRNLLHQEAIANLYLSLIIPAPTPDQGETKPQACRRWTLRARDRAQHIRWQADGDCVLRFKDYGRNVVLVPDATLECPAVTTRIFIELDRSTKTLSRVAETIKLYGRFHQGAYVDRFSDKYATGVLFVTPSQERARHILALPGKKGLLFVPQNLRALTHSKAVQWLALCTGLDAIGAEPAPAPASPPKEPQVAADLAEWAAKLLAEIHRLDHDVYFAREFLERGRQYAAALRKKG